MSTFPRHDEQFLSAVTALALDQFLATPLPPRETLLAPWLPKAGLAMIYAPRGLGKTQTAIGAAWAVASGSGFLRAGNARRLIVCCFSMARCQEPLCQRFKAVTPASYTLADPDYLKIAASDLMPFGLPDLADPKSQQYYDDVIADADLIVVDNLSTICPSVKEHERQLGARPSMGACTTSCRSLGPLVHHAGKSGLQRGSSRKEDTLGTVVALRRPPDYSPDQGCRFELHFEKSRGFHGLAAEPFEARSVPRHGSAIDHARRCHRI